VNTARKYGDEEAIERQREAISIEREHEISAQRTLAEQYASLLQLLAHAKGPLVLTGFAWLHEGLVSKTNALIRNLDPTLQPATSHVVDPDTTRELLRLYGSTVQHNEDMRDARKLEGLGPDNLFDWERR